MTNLLVIPEGKIIDFLTGAEIQDTPEERVRQKYLKILHLEYHYPKEVMKKEVTIYHGRKELKNERGDLIRADIIVYLDEKACKNKDQGKISFVVECKAPTEKDGYGQLVSYIFNTNANGGVWFNGSGENDEAQYYRRTIEPEQKLITWPNIPLHGESWDAVGRIKKRNLVYPVDVKGLLRRCHNRLHKRGSEEDDLTMDMVRIILAKTRDEEKESEYPNFYCTPEEYSSHEGREQVAKRINELFSEVRKNNPLVFEDYEKIEVGSAQIADVVVELQNYRLIADEKHDYQWDLMGSAYEEYTSTYLKKKKGQFFTNRLVIKLLVEMIDPNVNEIMLDPAGGSGGFITAVMRYVRKKIWSSASPESVKRRIETNLKNDLFMVETSKRLVKVAKTAMILSGDGHSNFTRGDSLGEFENLDQIVKARANVGVPKIILTNPPWAGVGEGKITDKMVLSHFDLGKVWIQKNGEYEPTQELLKEGVPPELLFLERCIEWLAPGGRLGIVLPKGVLDTDTSLAARHLIFQKTKVLGIINCHKNTFQPFTGPRPCLLLLQKRSVPVKISSIENHKIFMAINRKIGQDSQGKPIFKIDEDGRQTDQLDHDLNLISVKFKEFLRRELEDSDNIFSVNFNDIDKTTLRINPQRFLPSLNLTIKKILAIDDKEGWSVLELSQICQNVRIFKAPRLKSENLVIEEPKDTSELERYYTPSTLLQNKSESIKWFNLKVAKKQQINTINMLRLRYGTILVTRSGSIGRVIYVTNKLNGKIGSDDLIRIMIPDENLRLYAFHYLRNKAGQDQMKKNEYGSIQQHLEPEDIRKILIPIPDNLDQLNDFIRKARIAIRLQEHAFEADEELQQNLNDLLGGFE